MSDQTPNYKQKTIFFPMLPNKWGHYVINESIRTTCSPPVLWQAAFKVWRCSFELRFREQLRSKFQFKKSLSVIFFHRKLLNFQRLFRILTDGIQSCKRSQIEVLIPRRYCWLIGFKTGKYNEELIGLRSAYVCYQIAWKRKF